MKIFSIRKKKPSSFIQTASWNSDEKTVKAELDVIEATGSIFGSLRQYILEEADRLQVPHDDVQIGWEDKDSQNPPEFEPQERIQKNPNRTASFRVTLMRC